MLTLVARMRERPVLRQPVEPTVSVIISVWNEEDVLARKMRNLLDLDYPKGKVEILIGSDGSTDRTNEIMRGFGDERIRFWESDARRGKMAVINTLAAQARHELIVFTDARQVFAADTIRALAANFADPQVGCVSGELMFSRKEGGTAKGVNLYWSYEKFIRSQESKIHSMLGATGAVCAIRRELYPPVPENLVLDDMYIPFHIIKKGYRSIFDEQAKAFDEVADSPREEHRRKVRTLSGNYQIFALMPEMLNPFKSPIAVQLFSHKFLRLLIPFFLIIIFAINLFLLPENPFGIFFVLQILFYVMALIGALSRHQRYGMLKAVSKVCYIPYVFCLLNFSALAGAIRYFGGRQEVTWEKAREKRN
ncbi:MAG: glycosyltransferase family 2 protein [Candidatus Omnitrophota bacterium]